MPQVHGAVWEELQTSEEILQCEIDAVTDNPILFPEEGIVSHGGNFHAIHPARVSDRLASGLATLGSISERRIYLALAGQRRGLPAFLIENRGLNSGFMMLQTTAAALVSESKSLSFPASVDSIVTNNGQEDHVSMGPVAGLKANQVADNLRYILAIELITAAQALDLVASCGLPSRLEEIRSRIRRYVPRAVQDRAMSDDIELIARKIRDGDIIHN